MGNLPVTDGFPSQRPINASVWSFRFIRPNKMSNKNSSCRWFETSWPLHYVRVMIWVKWFNVNLNYIAATFLHKTSNAENVSMSWRHHGSTTKHEPCIINEMCCSLFSLQWRHNERGGVSNHRHLDCLLNHSFRRRSKKSPKLRVTGNSPVTGEFPAQRISNAGNVSIWWRHHVNKPGVPRPDSFQVPR